MFFLPGCRCGPAACDTTRGCGRLRAAARFCAIRAWAFLRLRGLVLSAGSRPNEGLTISHAQLPAAEPAAPLATEVPARLVAVRALLAVRYVAGVLVLAAAYYAAGRASLALQYEGPVAAIWLPVGVGAAALYVAGLRWWPGLLIGDVALADPAQPLASALGIVAGNIADILVIAVLLRLLLGPRAALDRLEQVGGMLVAIVAGAAITATVAVLSLRAGGVVESSELPTFWRSWFLADASGALVIIPLALAWAQPRSPAWRGRAAWEGALAIGAVVALSAIALSGDLPLTYMVFPALIWAAFRFGPPGASLAIAIAAGVAIGVTANDVGPFFKQPIDHRTLSTQLYIAVAALTTLFLTAVVSERERSSRDLAEARRTEGDRAVEERRRIARDLHDSVSQALFSTVLHTRTAQKALGPDGASPSGRVAQSLSAIAELTKSVQSEMRALIFELRRDPVHDGLVSALSRHAAGLRAADAPTIRVEGPASRLALSDGVETQLYGIGREALVNVVKHAHATAAFVRVEAQDGQVLIEVVDNGRGFDPSEGHPGHFGLDSMRSRATEIGGRLTIASSPGYGTVVRVRAPAGTNGS
jgi:signal transduction histidine kinase